MNGHRQTEPTGHANIRHRTPPVLARPLRTARVLPDPPTVGDFVPGYEASSWYGVGPQTVLCTMAQRMDNLATVADTYAIQRFDAARGSPGKSRPSILRGRNGSRVAGSRMGRRDGDVLRATMM
jgi:hypothetical protein